MIYYKIYPLTLQLFRILNLISCSSYFQEISSMCHYFAVLIIYFDWINTKLCSVSTHIFILLPNYLLVNGNVFTLVFFCCCSFVNNKNVYHIFYWELYWILLRYLHQVGHGVCIFIEMYFALNWLAWYYDYSLIRMIWNHSIPSFLITIFNLCHLHFVGKFVNFDEH